MTTYLTIDREMKSVQDALKQELMDAIGRSSGGFDGAIDPLVNF